MPKQTRLPCTSRINDKILEYYTKFGQERDLEKFMRLYSPAGSEIRSHSTTTTTSSTSDDNGKALRRLFIQQDDIGGMQTFGISLASSSSSSSSTNLLLDSKEMKKNTDKKQKDGEHIIPIKLQDENARQSDTAELLQTPKKSTQTAIDSKMTQTPDSIAKSHKRLEWDSLGDVGYKKSMSTSNISILERSLLREFFQENPSTKLSSHRPKNNASEGALNKLEIKLKKEYKITKIRTRSPTPTQTPSPLDNNKYNNTPPLASSTFMDAKSLRATKITATGVLPKQTSNSKLQRKYSEKYAQTSLNDPSVASQEVQVNMSNPSTAKSNVSSSVAPSSFEYFSTRSASAATSATTASTDAEVRRRRRRSKAASNPVVTEWSEMLAQRKALSIRNDENVNSKTNDAINDDETAKHMQEFHETLTRALAENKENSSSSSLSGIRSPQLDLGIQLLCSLIDAKSLTHKQKKKLVRDIVKRISHMGSNDDGIAASNGNVHNEISMQLRSINSALMMKKDLRAADKRRKAADTDPPAAPPASEEAVKDSFNMTDLGRTLPNALTTLAEGITSSGETEHFQNIQVYGRPSPPSTSAQALAKLSIENSSFKNFKTKQKVTERADSHSQYANSDANVLNITPDGVATSESNGFDNEFQINIVPKPHRQQQQEQQRTNSKEKTKMINERLDKPSSPSSDEIQIQAKTKSTKAKTKTNNVAARSSSSSSKDLTTQKEIPKQRHDNYNHDDANTDVEHATMREWLNPMTQSEIEYEEKKLELAKNAAKREKILRKIQTSTKADSERDVQLNWIEMEIQRLESLRHLLIKKDANRDSSVSVSIEADDTPIFQRNTKPIKPSATATLADNVRNNEKLYDTVFSEKAASSSGSSLSAVAHRPPSATISEPLVQEIEVIIEESNEDVINISEKLKRSKQRKRETQIYYDKATSEPPHANYGSLSPQGNALFRTITETITTNEEQVLPQIGEKLKSAKSAKSSNDRQKVPLHVNAVASSSRPPPPQPPPPPPPPVQRTKLDTPSSSIESESVCSFVRQRKREFIEQYKNKKKHHYETLLQQQQEQHQYLLKQQQKILYELRHLPAATATTAAQTNSGGHYSIPRTSQPPFNNNYNQYLNHYNQQQHQNFPYYPTQQTPTTAPPPAVHQYSGQHQQPQQQHPQPQQQQFPAATQTSAAAHVTGVPSSAGLTSQTPTVAEQHQQTIHSSSSIFCYSSEMSIPMGSADSSSIPTTTHQYDDVAGTARHVATAAASSCSGITVGVQTTDSLRHSKPILGPQPPNYIYDWRTTTTQPLFSIHQPVSVQVKPKAIAYVINFYGGSNSNTENSSSNTTTTTGGTNSGRAEGERVKEMGPQLTLQEHLERSYPQFCAQVKARKAILNQLQSLRLEREHEMREIIDNTSFTSLDKRLQRLPPPPTKRIRVFPTKVMKAMTNKRCEHLPEVLAKQHREREERRRRTNRLLRDVFNRRLQKRVRNGQLSLNHSKTVI